MFMYENTRAETHRVAAELIEAGVDVADTYRRLYERVPPEKLRLIGRALEKIERFDDGRLAVTYIGDDDYEATGASEVPDRGDHRLPPRARGHRRRGDDPRQDRRRARRAQGQPALHRRRGRRLRDRARARAAAATAAPPASAPTCPTTSWSPTCVPRSPSSSAERPAGADAGLVVLADKPAGVTSHDVVATLRRVHDAKGGHAGTLDPFATGLLIVLLGRPATREQRRFMELPKTYRVTRALRRRLGHRRPRRRDHRDRA